MNSAHSSSNPRRLRLVGLAVVVGAAGFGTLVILRRPATTSLVTWEPVNVRVAEAVDVLRETGTLAPRIPVVVPCPFDGRLQWVIEDATWVEAGQTVAIISDDDERRRIADDRSQLGEARQDLQIARLRRAQAESTEAAKVAAAGRDLELEQIRYRILTTPAEGSMAMVRIGEELAPLLAKVVEVRREAESARIAWQSAEAAWLEAVGRQQEAQDDIDRLESVVQDLAEAMAEASQKNLAVADLANERRKKRRQERALAKLNESEKANAAGGGTAPAKPGADMKSDPADDPALALGEARKQLTEVRTRAFTTAKEVKAAFTARELTAQPYQAARALEIQAENAAREPRIRLEIERRSLPATELAFDVQVATATLTEAERRLADVLAANATGVASNAELADAKAVRDNAEAALALVKERWQQAALPPTKEAVAEAEARLAKAKAAAAAADGVQRRNLALADAQIAVAQAKVDRYQASLASRTRRFPGTIEQDINTLLREREVKPEEAAQLDAAIATAREELALATASPPNVVSAPVTGLARVRREGNRQKLAGDQIWQADPVVEIHPPANLEVLVRVNEANVDRAAADQAVSVTIPALPGIRRTGKVLSVSGAGRDKGDVAGQPPRWTGVTQFDVRIALDPGAGDADLRQGMTALVEITTARRPDAHILPRGAGIPVTVPGGPPWAVMLAPDTPPKPVAAQPFGDDQLLVPDLPAGTTVYIKRVGHE